MQSNPIRFILSITAGVVVLYLVDVFLLSFAPALFGYQELSEGASRIQYVDYMQALPIIGQVGIIICCAIGAFMGGYVATRFAQRKKDAALSVGIFSIIILLFMAITFEFPIVLMVGMLVVQLPFALLGRRLGR